MPVLEQNVAVAEPRTKVLPSTTVPGGKSLSTMRCVVVSKNASRRTMLTEAAYEGGWDTIICEDAEAGWAAVKRQRFQLAIIDIDGVEHPEGLKELGQEVATMQETLLMLCGNEGEALEEIWARQLGAWLYLPGVEASSDVAALCEQAQPVAEKLQGLPGHFVG